MSNFVILGFVLVSLGAFLVWVLVLSEQSLFRFGRRCEVGYDVLDRVKRDTLDRSIQRVSVPWSNFYMAASARLAARLALDDGNFGATRSKFGGYRFYYSEGMTGNWFAEVWPTWKSALFAGIFLNPSFLHIPGKVAHRLNARNDYDGAALLVAGVYLVVMFLPRAIFGLGGAHWRAVSVISRKGWEASGTINLIAGLAGVSMLVLASQLSVDFGALASRVVEIAIGVLSESDASFWEGVIAVVAFPVASVAYLMALPLITGWLFWMIALKFHQAKNLFDEACQRIPGDVEGFYEGTKLWDWVNPTAVNAGSQFVLGGLVWLAFLFGYVLFPVWRVLASWF